MDVNIRWLVEFGVQDDGFPVLSENNSHTCNAIYGYPGGPDRAANLEMPVTSYPGGWKMKMRLCAAQLLNCDVLILDEPTGLDMDNIGLLEDRKLETSWESRAPLSCSW